MPTAHFEGPKGLANRLPEGRLSSEIKVTELVHDGEHLDSELRVTSA